MDPTWGLTVNTKSFFMINLCWLLLIFIVFIIFWFIRDLSFIFALYNLASVRIHIYDILRNCGLLFRKMANFFPAFTINVEHLERFERIIRWHKCTVRFYRAVRISSRGALYAYHSLCRAERVMSTWKNLYSEHLGSKVTSGIMGARGFNGPRTKSPFHIVGSVTQLYRSCSIRDTRIMIIEEEEEEETKRRSQT